MMNRFHTLLSLSTLALHVGCTTTNFASKKTCYRCNMSKPEEWVCALCNSMTLGKAVQLNLIPHLSSPLSLLPPLSSPSCPLTPLSLLSSLSLLSLRWNPC
jgi:hypothetical protein